jgi:hypothetical protein
MSSIQQGAELQAQIWKIANDVRGSIDGWDFKQYVLGTLFYRFITESLNTDFDTTGNRLGNTVKDKNSRLATALKGVLAYLLCDNFMRSLAHSIQMSHSPWDKFRRDMCVPC